MSNIGKDVKIHDEVRRSYLHMESPTSDVNVVPVNPPAWLLPPREEVLSRCERGAKTVASGPSPSKRANRASGATIHWYFRVLADSLLLPCGSSRGLQVRALSVMRQAISPMAAWFEKSSEPFDHVQRTEDILRDSGQHLDMVFCV